MDYRSNYQGPLIMPDGSAYAFGDVISVTKADAANAGVAGWVAAGTLVPADQWAAPITAPDLAALQAERDTLASERDALAAELEAAGATIQSLTDDVARLTAELEAATAPKPAK